MTTLITTPTNQTVLIATQAELSEVVFEYLSDIDNQNIGTVINHGDFHVEMIEDDALLTVQTTRGSFKLDVTSFIDFDFDFFYTEGGFRWERRDGTRPIIILDKSGEIATHAFQPHTELERKIVAKLSAGLTFSGRELHMAGTEVVGSSLLFTTTDSKLVTFSVSNEDSINIMIEDEDDKTICIIDADNLSRNLEKVMSRLVNNGINKLHSEGKVLCLDFKARKVIIEELYFEESENTIVLDTQTTFSKLLNII